MNKRTKRRALIGTGFIVTLAVIAALCIASDSYGASFVRSPWKVNIGDVIRPYYHVDTMYISDGTDSVMFLTTGYIVGTGTVSGFEDDSVTIGADTTNDIYFTFGGAGYFRRNATTDSIQWSIDGSTWYNMGAGGGESWSWTDSTGFIVGWGGIAKSVTNDTNYLRFEGSSDFDTTGGAVSLADDCVDSTNIPDSSIAANDIDTSGLAVSWSAFSDSARAFDTAFAALSVFLNNLIDTSDVDFADDVDTTGTQIAAALALYETVTNVGKIGDDTTHFKTAYGWGDHSAQNYLDNDDANVDTAAWNAGSTTLASVFNYMDHSYFDTTGFSDSIGIKSGSIGTAEIGTDGVGSAEIVAGGVGASEILNQCIGGDDVDSTSENFVFDAAYETTSESEDNRYSTHTWVSSSYFPLAGGQLTGNVTFSGAQTVDGIDVSAHAADADAHHNRSHTMTSTSDHTATAWRTFYSNASGNVTELINGTSGYFLKSNGASAAPSWAAETGDISNVTAGNGLTGGGASGSVTLNIGAGTGITVNADDIAATLGTTIETGEITNGTILAADLNQNSATSGQVLKWTGSAWAAANDETGGAYSDSTGAITDGGVDWQDLSDPAQDSARTLSGAVAMDLQVFGMSDFYGQINQAGEEYRLDTTMIAWAFPADTKLLLLHSMHWAGHEATYYDSCQHVHPDWCYIGSAKGVTPGDSPSENADSIACDTTPSYTHWMIASDFPVSNADYEEATIFGSRDGVTYEIPRYVDSNGTVHIIPAPLIQSKYVKYDSDPDDTADYLSDPELLLAHNGKFYYVQVINWTVGGPSGDAMIVWPSETGCYFDISDTFYVFVGDGRTFLSPSIVYDTGSTYQMFWVSDGDNAQGNKYIERVHISDIDDESKWVYQDTVIQYNMPTGLDAWHLNADRLGSNIIFWICAKTATGGSGTARTNWVAISTDNGKSIYWLDKPFLDSTPRTGWDMVQRYRGCALRNLSDEGLTYNYMYSGDSTGGIWGLGITKVHFCFSPTYVELTNVGGSSTSESDSTILSFPFFDGSSFCLLRDSSIGAAERDNDVIIGGVIPNDCMTYQLELTYNQSASCYIDSIFVYGPDVSNGGRRCDSLYYSSGVHIDSTEAWRTQTISFAPQMYFHAGDPVAVRIVPYLNAADDRLIVARAVFETWD